MLRTHHDTVQYESTDNVLNEGEFDALCSNHIADKQLVEMSLIRSGHLQVAVRDNDKKVCIEQRGSNTSYRLIIV